MTLFNWLLDKYQVFICSEVKFECFNNIKKSRVNLDDPDRIKREISALLFNGECKECLKYLDEFCAQRGFPKFPKVDEGERKSFALALYLSIKFREPVVVLTDDLAALESFNEILTEQKFAVAKVLPDFIISLFQSNEMLDENAMGRTLQSYYNIATKVDERKRIFNPRMKFNCRSYWFANCHSICFP